MRLSSISLIAAALATIGSAIAAPGPLRARALGGVNSFSEHDVDVNSHESGLALLEPKVDGEFADDLFIRINDGLEQAARAHDKAAAEHTLAAQKAMEVQTKAREASRKASGAAAGATRIADTAAMIADGAELAARRAAEDAMAAKNMHDFHHYRNEHFRHLDTEDLHRTFAAQYEGTSARHAAEAVGHHRMVAPLSSVADGHTTQAYSHTTQAKNLRKPKGPGSKDWERSEISADTSRGKATSSIRKSQDAINQSNVAIGRDRSTIAAYNGIIKEMANHYPHFLTPHEDH